MREEYSKVALITISNKENKMKVNPDTISICLEYLEKTKQVFDREECKNINKELMSNLFYLEESDFDKAISLLKKHKKVEAAFKYLQEKDKFIKGESDLLPHYFIRSLKEAATFHKRWETKKEIESEINSVFPEYELVEQTANFASSVSLLPFGKINLFQEAENFGAGEEQLNALVELL